MLKVYIKITNNYNHRILVDTFLTITIHVVETFVM